MNLIVAIVVFQLSTNLNHGVSIFGFLGFAVDCFVVMDRSHVLYLLPVRSSDTYWYKNLIQLSFNGVEHIHMISTKQITIAMCALAIVAVLAVFGSYYPVLGGNITSNPTLYAMKALAQNVRGFQIPNSGHWGPEERPPAQILLGRPFYYRFFQTVKHRKRFTTDTLVRLMKRVRQ